MQKIRKFTKAFTNMAKYAKTAQEKGTITKNLHCWQTKANILAYMLESSKKLRDHLLHGYTFLHLCPGTVEARPMVLASESI